MHYKNVQNSVKLLVLLNINIFCSLFIFNQHICDELLSFSRFFFYLDHIDLHLVYEMKLLITTHLNYFTSYTHY